MADGEKPYRVYRGGRARGRVPLTPRPEKGKAARHAGAGATGRRRWGRRIGITLALLFLLLVAWSALGYLSFRNGVEAANARLPRAVRANLAKQEGPVISEPSLILLLGTDGDRTAAREDARRSDSILIVRTDPSRHRLAYLSIPRDLRVDIPGHGPNKINAAFQLGGPVLAMKTVTALTGLRVNHVVLVDFQNFREVIDALGGVEIDVPKPILSNRFDCPYDPVRCRQWDGWRFAKGRQKMDGRRALIYSRIRENQLDPSENDLTRGGRQQEVVEAMTGKIVGPSTFARLPFIGEDLITPLTTDLSAGQLLQLGWVKFRANSSRALHCRLGGEPSTSFSGESVLIGTEENTAAIAMFTGRSAAQPPPPGTTFGAGCVIGTGRSG